MGAARAHRVIAAGVGCAEERAGHLESRPRTPLRVELHAKRESREVLRDRRTGEPRRNGRA